MRSELVRTNFLEDRRNGIGPILSEERKSEIFNFFVKNSKDHYFFECLE